MDELKSNDSVASDNQIDSSFQDLRMSNNQFQSLQPYDPTTIQQVNIQLPQKSISDSVIETYKMCTSAVRTLKTNIAYNLRHSTFDVFTKREKVILTKELQVTLLGKVYESNSADKERFLTDFNNVIWLTYRSGIYGIETDAGWGCMIRVCQMVLAETFKRLAPQMPLKQIIDFFRDTPEAYFSLTRICEKGDIKQRWTSSIQIFTLFKNLMHQFKAIPVNMQLHSCCVQISDMNQLEFVQYPLMLFISNRLGKNKFQIEFREHILQVMKVPCFVGVLGGNGGEALYLVGHYADKFIFMDPHYVQEFEEDEVGKKTSTYFQSQPYSIDAECLAPSMAFTFLVKSRQEYEKLLVELYTIQTKYYPWVGFEINSEPLRKTVKPLVHKDDLFQDII